MPSATARNFLTGAVLVAAPCSCIHPAGGPAKGSNETGAGSQRPFSASIVLTDDEVKYLEEPYRPKPVAGNLR